MKSMKLALAGAAFLTGAAFFAQAQAADIYQRGGSLKDEPAYAPAISWAGFYAGVHAGGAWGSVDVTELDNYNDKGHTFSYDTDGFMGGIQVGYNFQRGGLVFGIEADLGYMNANGGVQDPVIAALGRTPNDSWASMDGGLYGTLTGRLGLATGSWLLYAKGGAAFLNADVSFEDTNPLGLTLVNGTTNSDTLSGWVLGGGVEVALTNNWSLKAEYLHFDFGTATVAAQSPGGQTYRFDNDIAVDTVKAGLNYRFGSHGDSLK